MHPSSEAPIEIILVHGTFARNAPWTHPSSKLCIHLRDALAGNVHFEQFIWSGFNTFSAREKAAEKLSELIRSRPNCKNRFIIAHSHGGSVAAQALTRFPEINGHLGGVVFLSTPFISAKHRANWKAVDYLIESIISIFLRLGKYIALLTWAISDNPIITYILPIVMLLLYEFRFRLSGYSILGGIKIQIKDFFDETPRHLKKPLEYPELPRLSELSCANIKYALHVNVDASKCLIIRTTADEASMALNFAHLLSLLASLAIWPIVGLVALFAPALFLQEISDEEENTPEDEEKIAAANLLAGRKGFIGKFARTTLIVSIACSVLAAILAAAWRMGTLFGFEGDLNSPIFYVTLIVVMTPIWFLVAVALLLLPLFLFIYVFVAIAAVPFGLAAAYGILFLEFSSETTPRGQWAIFQAPSSHSETVLGPQMAHSQSYENQYALERIVEWIKSRI